MSECQSNVFSHSSSEFSNIQVKIILTCNAGQEAKYEVFQTEDSGTNWHNCPSTLWDGKYKNLTCAKSKAMHCFRMLKYMAQRRQEEETKYNEIYELCKQDEKIWQGVYKLDNSTSQFRVNKDLLKELFEMKLKLTKSETQQTIQPSVN